MKIVLFYKVLNAPGGAERLLAKEYKYFKKFGYDVEIWTYSFDPVSLFINDKSDINDINVIIIRGTTWVSRLLKLTESIKKNRDAVYLCSSGHIDIYLACTIAKVEYSLHIHHPEFMSFNTTDKYSIFLKDKFEEMLESNYGASRFRVIRSELTLRRKAYINVNAFVSIRSIKNAKKIFVLSNYAKKEKKRLYDVESEVLYGALEEDIFQYKGKSVGSEYDDYKYRILTIARIDKNKRIDVLLKAFKKFLSEEKNSILLIGGNGNDLPELKKLSKELKIDNNVKFLGFVPDDKLYDYYKMADLFASIDWADYRITSYEALAMGTKVLLSEETDFDEELVNCGYLHVTTPNIAETATAIKTALEAHCTIDKAELKEYLEKYTWENYFREILKVLAR